jgi:A/G-specific adenine glycosylase
MYELPPLPLEAVEGLEPALRIRHAITNTNYYMQVFSSRRTAPAASLAPAISAGPGRAVKQTGATVRALRSAVPAESRELHWTRTTRLAGLPLTGLTRKILQRLKVMENPRIALPE